MAGTKEQRMENMYLAWRGARSCKPTAPCSSINAASRETGDSSHHTHAWSASISRQIYDNQVLLQFGILKIRTTLETGEQELAHFTRMCTIQSWSNDPFCSSQSDCIFLVLSEEHGSPHLPDTTSYKSKTKYFGHNPFPTKHNANLALQTGPDLRTSYVWYVTVAEWFQVPIWAFLTTHGSQPDTDTPLAGSNFSDESQQVPTAYLKEEPSRRLRESIYII